MPVITYLYGVFRITSPGGPIKMSLATPEEILARVLLMKESIDRIESAIANPSSNLADKSAAYKLLESFVEELEETWDYYVAKIKAKKAEELCS